MRIGAIVQARMSSTRLSGKVLKELPYGSGITVLQQVIRRLKKCSELDNIIIATTQKAEDDEIINIAEKENICWFRGSEENVLERYLLAAKQYGLDSIVRITGDCPCIDANIVDLCIHKYVTSNSNYASNVLTRTYPRGFDTEVLSFETLEENYRRNKIEDREHVTLYIRKNPHLFRVAEIKAPKELEAPDIRLTIDTEEDYALLCAVFDYLYPQDNYFDSHKITDLFAEKPWLKLINKRVMHKKYYLGSLKEEIEEAVNVLDLQGLKQAKEILKKHS